MASYTSNCRAERTPCYLPSLRKLTFRHNSTVVLMRLNLTIVCYPLLPFPHSISRVFCPILHTRRNSVFYRYDLKGENRHLLWRLHRKLQGHFAYFHVFFSKKFAPLRQSFFLSALFFLLLQLIFPTFTKSLPPHPAKTFPAICF